MNGVPANQPLKVCVFGAGASGGHLAVRLHGAGHAVSVVARGAQLQAIRSQGLQLQQDDQVLHAGLAATDRPAELGVQDVVLVATKATAIAGLAPSLAPLVGADTRVVFLQNGMTWWYPVGLPTGKLAPPALPLFEQGREWLRLLKSHQLHAGILYTANEVVAPGVVRNNSPRRNAIELGAVADAPASAVDALRELVRSAGMDAPPVEDIRRALWLKLVGNCSASSMAVALRGVMGIAEEPAVQQVFLRMVDECLQVAAAHGYPIEEGLDTSHWIARRGRHKPSMLQDLEAGRPMEIAEMVLAPVAFARAAGLATPTLDAVTAIAARIAREAGLYRPD